MSDWPRIHQSLWHAYRSLLSGNPFTGFAKLPCFNIRGGAGDSRQRRKQPVSQNIRSSWRYTFHALKLGGVGMLLLLIIMLVRVILASLQMLKHICQKIQTLFQFASSLGQYAQLARNLVDLAI